MKRCNNNVCKYPTAAEIRRVVKACEKAGVTIGSVEISRDGAIRVGTSSAKINEPANDFDDWDSKGLL